MELNDWLAITGALRDWKLSAGIHILCKPQNARKENASADSVENEVDWLEKRIVQCTAKSVERTALVSRSTSYMALSSL
jgi:uracil-DNA glycosylase